MAEKKEPKVTWTIHGVQDIEKYFTEEIGIKCPYIGNFHTHGLDKYNHRELCISIALGVRAAELLNAMGLRIAAGETVFTEGIRTDILQNEMDVEIISFENDPTLYIILPDANGKLPSDDDCAEPYKYQYKYAKMIHDDEGYV